MSPALSNSPASTHITDAHDAPATAIDPEPGQTPQYRVLAQAHWPGVEVLLCKEDIRQRTLWSIDEPRHTVIVHLGGTMRELDTEIEGVGATHMPPSPGDIWLVPAGKRYASQASGQIITYAELRVSPTAEVDMGTDRRAAIEGLMPRLGHRDEFLHYSVARLVRLSQQGDDLSAMMAERLQLLLRQHLYDAYRLPATPVTSPVVLSPHVARRLSDHIETVLGERIALSTLAALAGMSVHQLLIAFRRTFGTTPAQYILAQRLRRARWYLLNRNDDITAIALACGFASHSHLSASFKRDAGITPRQFRDGLRMRPLD
ncbi:AraC family transcriptional regulator [uncultured Pseudoxanthomonas sp.]|uniref:helix-turn-helix transcriptional regulator n=1 Tax=uncultured Pseudoxanthomonas sp. TaxID=281701 RepID=UPI00263A1D20|nr:AraC family transcriptional regulator [uncultured Pseudoxanthomonas sp.]